MLTYHLVPAPGYYGSGQVVRPLRSSTDPASLKVPLGFRVVADPRPDVAWFGHELDREPTHAAPQKGGHR